MNETYTAQTIYRKPDEGYAGPIFTWDVDNTYLSTNLHSLLGMIGTAVEFAVDKKPVPGAVWLLRELRRERSESGELQRGGERRPIYFVSASPAAMRPVLERRLLLDEIEFDGITLRNWTGLLLSGRLGAIRTAFAYKLLALLGNRLVFPAAASEVLFGDDLEQDPLIYATYSRILEPSSAATDICALVSCHGLRRSDARYLEMLAERARNATAARRAVARVIIRRDTTGGRCVPYECTEAHDSRIRAVDDMLQAALVLHAEHIVSLPGVHRVALGMLDEGVRESRLWESLERSVQRGLCSDHTARSLAEQWGSSIGTPIRRTPAEGFGA
ncbi:MAG: hypothetical protein HYV63_23885 [Candidatus Schekmanbacteria bacterium]|nr:hypothetical protein [Candidatus Schekmanbacteria bacterium]